MILSASQSRRFRRLFESFIIFCAARLDVDIIVAPDRWLAQGDIDAVFDTIVDETRDISDLVAAYVEANPDRLNRTELREVSQWSDALYAGFAFIRDGADTYLLFGGLAFAVRGISGESDLSELDVDFLHTIIVPFDGVLTYALSRNPSVGPPPEAARGVIEGMLERAREERRVIRTARQYHAKVAAVRELPVDAMRTELLERAFDIASAERDPDGHEASGNHVGVLAGLSWDERKAAIEESSSARWGDGRLAELSRMDFDAAALKGGPTTSYRKMLNRHSTVDLRELAEELDLVEDASFMGRAELVKLVREATPMTVEGLLWPVIMRGTEALESVGRVLTAGGHMETERASVKSRFDFPMPIFPATQLYVVGDTYRIVMCDEVREVLEKADWVALMRRAQTFDDVCHFLETVVDARGIARLEDAFRECVATMRVDESAQDILLELDHRMQDGRAGFYIEDYEGEPWFRSILLDGYSSMSRMMPSMAELVACHAKMEPRPVNDMLPFRWTSTWLAEFEETRALAAFLDAHVPDEENDYVFADNAIDEIMDLGLLPLSPEVVADAFELLENKGLTVEGDEREVLRSLLVDYMDRVPKWIYNGWSSRELRERSGMPKS